MKCLRTLHEVSADTSGLLGFAACESGDCLYGNSMKKVSYLCPAPYTKCAFPTQPVAIFVIVV